MLAKKFVGATLFLFTFLISVSAQQSIEIVDWKMLKVPAMEFSVEVPKYFDFKTNMPEPKVQLDQFKSRGEFQSDDERFYLFVDTVNKNEQFEKVMDFFGKHLSAAKKRDLLENNGGNAEFLDTDGYYHRVRFYKTLFRTITIQTVSTVKDSEAAVRFINSFTFFTKNEKQTDVASAEQIPLRSDGNIVRENSDDSNHSSPITNQRSDQAKSSYIPLRLTEKPRASYNKFAVFYNIQGLVRLRVTFGSDGTIGNIATIKKLPFGLVDTSIYAAQNMKFMPAERDGRPITTTRLVEYIFTIY